MWGSGCGGGGGGMIPSHWTELYFCDFEKNMFKTGLRSIAYAPILMIDMTKLHLILV